MKDPATGTLYLPFKILVGDEAKTARTELGDKAGLIEIDVFEEGTAKAQGEQQMQISARGIPPSKEAKARESYRSLRKALLASANLKTKTVASRDPKTLKVAKRELIVEDKDKKTVGSKLKVVDFNATTPVAHLVVKVIAKEAQPAEGGE